MSLIYGVVGSTHGTRQHFSEKIAGTNHAFSIQEPIDALLISLTGLSEQSYRATKHFPKRVLNGDKPATAEETLRNFIADRFMEDALILSALKKAEAALLNSGKEIAIIYGITNEEEATAIKDKGGKMIELVDSNYQRSDSHFVDYDSIDYLFNVDSSSMPDEESILEFKSHLITEMSLADVEVTNRLSYSPWNR